MRSPKTSITNGGSILIELSLAVALASITFVALASLIFNRQSFAYHMHEERLNITSAIHHMQNATGSTTMITPCLKRVQALPFERLIADLEYAQHIGGDCGGTFPSISTSSPPIISSLKISDTASTLDVINSIMVVGENNGTSSKLLLYKHIGSDISQLSSLSTHATIAMIDAIQSTVFIARTSTSSQFQIVDINNPHEPIITSSHTLPTVAGSYPGATSVSYYNKKVYVGTHRTAGREFHVYDVASTPKWLGAIELNHNINAITIREPYAFLATSGNTFDVMILDISIPTSIKHIGSVSLIGNEDALSLFLSGKNLYVGRKKSLKPNDPDFAHVDISDPKNPILIDTKIYNKDISSIRMINNQLFLAGLDGSRSLDFEHSSLYTLSTTTLTITNYHP